jgi:uncharacterized protein (DUF924 family)
MPASIGYASNDSPAIMPRPLQVSLICGSASRGSCLALVILLDQFPRNMFRNTSRAFATDSAALGVARGAIAEGFDRQLPPLRRVFLPALLA